MLQPPCLATALVLASVLSASASAAPEPATAFRLVDGDVHAVIVGSDDIRSRVENGYQTIPAFLQTYIEKSTGVKLRKVREQDYDPATMPHVIFTPGTEAAKERYGAVLAEVDRDGYVVAVTPSAVYLAGAREHSGEYAMIDFLEMATGAATYIPTSWGTVVPQHERIVLEPSYRLEIPAFTARALSCLRTYHDTGERLNYAAKTDIPWRLYRRDHFHHGIQSFIPVEEFGQTHPEYFPEINGKRLIVSKATAPGPCISNPGVVEVVIRKARAWFDDPKHADEDMISLGMTDGGWCECAACRATDGPDINGAMTTSRRYYTFLNQVARALQQSHPGKRIGVLAYAGAEYPPADMRVEPNITPYICQTRANWGDPAVRNEHLRQTLAWASRVDRTGTYEYLYGAGFLVPRIYHEHLAEHLRTVAKTGGGGFYAEIYSNHALDGPKAWITEKLAWDPFQDPAALQKRWCDALFGGAAATSMDAYFTYLQACNTRNILRVANPDTRGKTRPEKFYLLSDEKQFELFTPQEIDRAQALLADARGATEDPAIHERIDYFARGLRVSELSVQAYHAFRKAQVLASGESGSAGDAAILAALIEGEASAPQADPVLLMQEAIAADASSFTPIMPVAITTGTELSVRLVNGKPWDAVYEAIGRGQRGRESLAQAAQAQLLAMAPQGWEQDAFAARRVQMLLDMCTRIAVARRTATAPVIDGVADEAGWQWQAQAPWWQWKSGLPYGNKTETAFCHDGKMLYVALRCWQDDLADRRRAEGYGVPGWKYVSVEFHLNPDGRDASPEEVARFQAIPTLGGGMWANTHDALPQWKVSEGDGYWQAEMAIDLVKLGMTPDRFPALRMNMIRNVREAGHYGKGWFPSAMAHADPMTRGWLVFE